MKVRSILYVLLGFLLITQIPLSAQEFNANVKVNTEQLQGTDKSVFEELERKLTSLINDNTFTALSFSPMERIKCQIAINLTSMEESGKYKGELFITAQRPVYNASYTTTLLTFRDVDLSFTYQPYDQLVYNPNALDNNLTATVVYWLYVVLALDMDSFSPLGGSFACNRLRQLVNTAAQIPDTKGWNAFDGTHSRYAMAEALNDPAQEPFRKYWYLYHRKGLDELVANVQRGRTTMLESLKMLEQVWQERNASPLLMVFSQSKLAELVSVAEKATSSEKENAHKILNKLYPTEGNTLSALKR